MIAKIVFGGRELTATPTKKTPTKTLSLVNPSNDLSLSRLEKTVRKRQQYPKLKKTDVEPQILT